MHRLVIPLSMIIAAAIAASIEPFRSPAGSGMAPEEDGLKPLVDVHEFMEHVVASTFATAKQGLEGKPADANAWRSVRSASLILGECGNLLMIRKPEGADRAEWSKLCAALRESGDTLAKAAKSKDYNASRTALVALVQSCNQCHVKYGDDGEPKIEPL